MVCGRSTGDTQDFYPRSPCGERPSISARYVFSFIFLSTLSLRRATGRNCPGQKFVNISIHALLAESDSKPWTRSAPGALFLSTLSLRRATQTNTGSNESGEFLSTLSLRRATAVQVVIIVMHTLFLSTLSLRRATRRHRRDDRSPIHFYPRSPCGERPHPIGVPITVIEISIHALLAESD